jgi:ferrous iron transport protein A
MWYLRAMSRTPAAATLRDLGVGESAVLGEPRVPEAQRRRLAELGLRPGETVTITQRAVGGARVVAVHGSRIALDGRTASQLALRPDEAP